MRSNLPSDAVEALEDGMVWGQASSQAPHLMHSLGMALSALKRTTKPVW